MSAFTPSEPSGRQPPMVMLMIAPCSSTLRQSEASHVLASSSPPKYGATY